MERPFPSYRGSEPYIFVSWAHDDADIVFADLARLRDAGFNVWYDEGIQPGATWREEVALALTESKLFLYFVSPNSVHSENCHQELNFALSRERKILAVHLTNTQLTAGIELSLSNKQAIMREDYTAEAYIQKLINAAGALMPSISPVALPGITAKQAIDEKSIAILPFVNRSPDPDNVYLCDGMAEELIGGLAKVKDLSVASQLSSFGLKGQNLDTAAIGDRLGVANVLTGSIQKSGERVRITVTLTDVASNKAIWSEHYNGTLEDVFALQEDVARKVVDALKVELIGESARDLVNAGTTIPAAYDAFLRGRSELNKQTRTSLIAAADWLKSAFELDPSFGRARFLYFIVHLLQRNLGFLPDAEFKRIGPVLLDEVDRTGWSPPLPRIQMERNSGLAVMPPAPIMVDELATAIREQDPNWHGTEYFLLGVQLINAGLWNGAADYIKWFLDHGGEMVIDTPAENHYLELLFALGRFEKAIEHAGNVLAQQPHRVLVLGIRALLYSRTGQYTRAEEDLADLAKTFPRNFAQFYDLYWRRNLDAARAYFEWMDGQRNLAPVMKVMGCFLLGRIEKGMDYLEAAGFPPQVLRVGALYPLTPSIIAEVTAHPRYKALLAAHGLDDAWRNELMERVNALEPMTGIHVALDTEY